MTAALEGRAITKTYGHTAAVDRLDFEVRTGAVTAFLGPNGAGKTTTIRLLLGLVRPDSGEALVFGEPYRSLKNPARRVGALVDGSGFHPGRTAIDHLRSIAAAVGVRSERVGQVLEICDLDRPAHRKVGGFSMGMRQRLGLATALLGEPDLLVLDEPANGLDPAGIRWLRGYLRSYAETGRTVFVSSHALEEVANMADEVIVVKDGRLVVHETTSQLLRRNDAVVVQLDDIEGARAALTDRGAEVETLGDNRLRVRGLSEDQITATITPLGLNVIEMTTSAQTLEEAFLGLIDNPGGHHV